MPGAPASSLLTGSQVPVLNPGVEICAPVCVAIALLSTLQPAAPRFDRSLAPVLDGEAGWMPAVAKGAAPPAGEAGVSGAACALDASQTSVVAETTATAQRAD